MTLDPGSGCLNWFIDCLSEVSRYLEDHPTQQVVSREDDYSFTTRQTQLGAHIAHGYQAFTTHGMILQVGIG